MKKIKGIDLIIKDLETSKYRFTRCVLHTKRGKKCHYCGEGLLMKKSNIPQKYFSGLQVIEDVVESDIMLEKRYGIDFTKAYKNIVRCCGGVLEDFETVITHLNDAHSRSHKKLATELKEFNKVYNLETGEKRY